MKICIYSKLQNIETVEFQDNEDMAGKQVFEPAERASLRAPNRQPARNISDDEDADGELSLPSSLLNPHVVNIFRT